MTTELQRAMARYEDARIEYKKAVLASLNAGAGGEAIRHAIREFQQASADLRRLTGRTAHAAAAPRAPRGPVNSPAPVERTVTGLSFFRRLLAS